MYLVYADRVQEPDLISHIDAWMIGDKNIKCALTFS